ncbi:cupredoxin domain-containing protein [Castellaniella caeni]|nr:cupredoxin family protein [Castellaniella caeni]
MSHPATGTHAGHPSATRIVHVAMDDTMRFHPSTIAVHVGETITLDIKNTGKLQHELTIGKLDELQAHAQQMRQHPDMPAHHEANAITLDPGHQGTLTWTFATPGTLDFACLIPGHYEAGMKGQFVVSQE